jgi:hypothetical protein
MTLTSWKSLVAMAGLAAASAGCGDVVRQGRAPVVLVLDSLSAASGASGGAQFGSPLYSDVITNVTSPAPCKPDSPCPTIFGDLGKARFSLAMKDVSFAPTSNNNVTLHRFHVEYVRADGRATPGVDVPYAFDGGLTITVPAGSNAEGTFALVRTSAKEESPLVQLGSNPGAIHTIAYVTFYGTDTVGNDVTVTGTISVDFSNYGDK